MAERNAAVGPEGMASRVSVASSSVPAYAAMLVLGSFALLVLLRVGFVKLAVGV